MSAQPHGHSAGGRQAAGRGGHGWMMIACCIPMIVIAIILVMTGVAGPGFVFAAFLCTAMMALMMWAWTTAAAPRATTLTSPRPPTTADSQAADACVAA